MSWLPSLAEVFCKDSADAEKVVDFTWRELEPSCLTRSPILITILKYIAICLYALIYRHIYILGA